jgi:stress-induced morphogen
VDKATLEKLIATGIPGAQVDAVDLHGTGDHFEVTVVSDRFEGETLVKRHRLVYDAIGDAMRSEIHALMIRAPSPDQFRDGLQKIG